MNGGTLIPYHSVAPSGWCAGCGRKLTPDGQCPNCDAWWASPLVRVGGPLALTALALLALLVGVLRPDKPAASSAATPTFQRTADAASKKPVANRRSHNRAAHDLIVSANAPLLSSERAAPPRPISHAEQVHLRLLSTHVDAVIARDDTARARHAFSDPPSEASANPAPGGAVGFTAP